MRHLDLFSGIGGFALATEMAWPDEQVEHIFCDNEPFSQAILKKHWPNSLIYGDIRTLTGIGKVDLVTGGFPCQPFSAAGRRAGTEDDRHLWPEMLRVIRETNPTFVLGENVGGLLTWDGGLVLEMVMSDLEEAGYEAGAFVIPACALDAPHRRDRVWIAAHAIGGDAGGTSGGLSREKGQERIPERDQVGKSGEPSAVRDDANAQHAGLERPELEEAKGYRGQSNRGGSHKRRSWAENWAEVAAQFCTLDDGLPNGLARPRGWRNAALKGAGNAIVPQVAAQILHAMKESI
jgi:DNA (cytosine-5)-methyltransferase 1